MQHSGVAAQRLDVAGGSALVNRARVRELRRATPRDWSLVLADGTELPVSRRLRPALQRQLGRLDEDP